MARSPSSARKRVRQDSERQSPSTPALAPLYDSYAYGEEDFNGRYDDDLGVYEEDDEEQEEDLMEYDDEVDDEVDDDGDDMDGVVVTPSKSRRRGGDDDSRMTTPYVTPSKRRSSARKKTRTPRKAALEIDPSAPGFVRPNAADAYFLAAARPKRRGTIGTPSGVLDGVAATSSRKRTKIGAEIEATHDGDPNGTRTLGNKTVTAEERRMAYESRNRQQYEQWESELLSGHNLIFFGHGSKRLLLNDFVTSRLSRLGHCMVINGLYPGLSIKDVLMEIEASFPEIKSCPLPPVTATGAEKAAYRIYAHFLPKTALPAGTSFPTATRDLFLVLNNIDGSGLRTTRSLSVLSLLATCPRIHIITSFDHVNTPILFSATATNTQKHVYTAGLWTGAPPASRGFAWAWHQVTTYAPYTLEIEYAKQSSAFLSSGGAGGETVTEEGALRVLHSVTINARRLFKLLLRRQIAAIPETAEADEPVLLTLRTTSAPSFAMDGDLLQKTAREKMIATQEERFNALIGEFKDHGLAVEFGTQDEGGRGRWTWVPLGRSSLIRLVESMHDVDD